MIKMAELDFGSDPETMTVTVYDDGEAVFAVCDNGVQNMYFTTTREETEQLVRLLLSALKPKEGH